MIRDLLLRGIKQQELFKVTSSNCSLAVPENFLYLNFPSLATLETLLGKPLVLKAQEESIKHNSMLHYGSQMLQLGKGALRRPFLLVCSCCFLEEFLFKILIWRTLL